MGLLLRVFDVALVPPGGGTPPAIERAEKIILRYDGDAAKKEARALLEHSGSTVRSINWSPGPRGPELVAYVTTKEEA